MPRSIANLADQLAGMVAKDASKELQAERFTAAVDLCRAYDHAVQVGSAGFALSESDSALIKEAEAAYLTATLALRFSHFMASSSSPGRTS